MSWNTLSSATRKAAILAFKTAGTYTRLADLAHPIPLSGVYNQPNKEVDPQTGASIISVGPTFGIDLADLPVPAASGDQVTVNGTTYNVFDVQEDGQGGAELILAKAT